MVPIFTYGIPFHITHSCLYVSVSKRCSCTAALFLFLVAFVHTRFPSPHDLTKVFSPALDCQWHPLFHLVRTYFQLLAAKISNHRPCSHRHENLCVARIPSPYHECNGHCMSHTWATTNLYVCTGEVSRVLECDMTLLPTSSHAVPANNLQKMLPAAFARGELEQQKSATIL